MEVTGKISFKEKLIGFFFKEKKHFTTRVEINWRRIKKCLLLSVGVGIIVLLALPNTNVKDESFHETAEAGSTSPPTADGSDPTQDAVKLLNTGGGSRTAPNSLDYLYSKGTSAGGNGATSEEASSMILPRSGIDAKNQVPPGSRISVRLYEKAIVANQGMPVIGIVTKDFTHEDDLAIPSGSKLFGSIAYEDGGDRAKVEWRSIQFSDGRERLFSAIGVSSDGQVGVKGRVHSDALMNTAGQTLTRFIGAYAEGSLQKGAQGANQGGTSNGLKNAVADTAKDRADKWATDLKKEKKWIEVSNTTEFFAVLTQNFAFRDPGNTYGR